MTSPARARHRRRNVIRARRSQYRLLVSRNQRQTKEEKKKAHESRLQVLTRKTYKAYKFSDLDNPDNNLGTIALSDGDRTT